jgi:tryptophanase
MSEALFDFAKQCLEETRAEPFRTKSVESLALPSRASRERILAEAYYSPAYLRSEDVFLDFATDSGTGAMSDMQWSALMRGDESYVRSRNFYELEDAVREVTGFPHVIPTHQGRAAENILMELLLRPGQTVLSNTHFDTTRAHVQRRGARPIDLVSDSLWEFATPAPFKGNFDLEKLDVALARLGETVGLVIITIVNNFACSSPVSLSNMRAVAERTKKLGIPLFIDAARFSENAFFIHEREEGYADKTIASIARDIFDLADGCWMSAKKDAIVNIGGFIAVRDEKLGRKCQELLVLYEGFPSYGGLARRDLSAMAVGLREGMNLEYLRARTAQVALLADEFEKVGVRVSQPAGGSGVFVDVKSIYPHLGAEKLPGIALACDLYLEGGIRAGAAPFHMETVDLTTGEIVDRVFEFARFAVPRRVYSDNHMRYTARVLGRVKEQAHESRGFRVTHMPEVLGHFFAQFAPAG